MTVKICTPNTGSSALGVDYRNGSFELYLTGQPGRRAYAAIDAGLGNLASFQNTLGGDGRPVQNLWVDDPTKYDVIFRTRLGVVISTGFTNLADNLFLFAADAAIASALTALGITASTLTGTTKQITVDNSTPGITLLSTPQNLDTAANLVTKTIEAAPISKKAAVSVALGAAAGTTPGSVTQPVAGCGLPFTSFSFTTGTSCPTGVVATLTFGNGVDLGSGNAVGQVDFVKNSDGSTVKGNVSRTSSTTLTVSSIGVGLADSTIYSVRVTAWPTAS